MDPGRTISWGMDICAIGDFEGYRKSRMGTIMMIPLMWKKESENGRFHLVESFRLHNFYY